MLEQCENLNEVELFMETKTSDGKQHKDANYILAILDARKKFVAHERFQYVLLKKFGESDQQVCKKVYITNNFSEYFDYHRRNISSYFITYPILLIFLPRIKNYLLNFANKYEDFCWMHKNNFFGRMLHFHFLPTGKLFVLIKVHFFQEIMFI